MFRLCLIALLAPLLLAACEQHPEKPPTPTVQGNPGPETPKPAEPETESVTSRGY